MVFLFYFHIIYINEGNVMDKLKLSVVLESKGYSPEYIKNFFNVMVSYDYQLSSVDFNLSSFREVVLWSVQYNGFSLEHAAAELKNDYEIVLMAVKKDGKSLQFAGELCKSNKDIVMAAVDGDGYALRYASDELKSNKEVVLLAIGSKGSALAYAGDACRDDEEVVLSAIENSSIGVALEFASDRLRNEPKIVLAALLNAERQGAWLDMIKDTFKFASLKLKDMVGKDNPIEALRVIIDNKILCDVIKNTEVIRKKMRI